MFIIPVDLHRIPINSCKKETHQDAVRHKNQEIENYLILHLKLIIKITEESITH